MSGARYRPDAGRLAAGRDRRARGAAAAHPQGGWRPASSRATCARAADEILLADGLGVADARRAERWARRPSGGSPIPRRDDELDLSAIADGHMAEIEVRRTADEDDPVRSSQEATPHEVSDEPADHEDHRHRRRTTGDHGLDRASTRLRRASFAGEIPRRRRTGSPPATTASSSGPPSPARAATATPSASRAQASEDVRHLFPVPDATDWDVGELRYERKRSK